MNHTEQKRLLSKLQKFCDTNAIRLHVRGNVYADATPEYKDKDGEWVPFDYAVIKSHFRYDYE